MKVTVVRFGRTYSLPGYESARVDLEAVLDPDENIEQALDTLSRAARTWKESRFDRKERSVLNLRNITESSASRKLSDRSTEQLEGPAEGLPPNLAPQPEEKEELNASGTWQALHPEPRVTDPRGWDTARLNESWAERISFVEYQRRVAASAYTGFMPAGWVGTTPPVRPEEARDISRMPELHEGPPLTLDTPPAEDFDPSELLGHPPNH